MNCTLKVCDKGTYNHRQCCMCPHATHEGCHTAAHGTLYCEQCHNYFYHVEMPEECIGTPDTYI